MKKVYFSGIFSLLAVLLGYSQNIPQGMNYQAVARDKSGKELANQQISLQISLYSPDTAGNYYVETQSVTTNEFGLFTLVIGEGVAQTGIFSNVPWSTKEVWMQVAIQMPGQQDYSVIGSSKLYTVPYAFVAGNLAANNGKPKDLAAGSNVDPCPCNGGITALTFLYLGPSGVTIRVYNNAGLQNTGLIQTYANVSNGAVLTINVPNGGTLQSQTYFQFSAIPNAPPVTAVPTVCSSSYNALNPASPGGTWGNISVISQTDGNGETCTACNVNGLWYIGGNAVLSACNTLGTLSNNDLVLISNNTPRMVVSAGGDVTANNNLNVDKGLNVLGNVALNQSSGATTNNGPFTVANFSPTLLTGSLTTNGATLLNSTLTVGQATNLNGLLNVNNQQPSYLSGNLTVNRATKLDSSLWVNGNTDLHGYLHVDEQAPSVFTGTIEGYDNATFLQQVLVTNASLDASSPSTGALVVAGGTGIGQALYVGGPTSLLGSLSVGGNTDLFGYLHVDNGQPTLLTGTLADSGDATFFQHVLLTNSGLNSNGFNNGALVVAGGVGIEENLNVGGSSTFGGPVSFNSVVTFADTVQSTSYSNGTIIVDGGAGIAKNLNVNGNTNLTKTVINADLSGAHSDPTAYPLTVEGSNQGIRIQVNGASSGVANMTNNYLQFVDNTGTAHGSITGETATDVAEDVEYEAENFLYTALVVYATYNVYSASTDLTEMQNEQVEAAKEEEEASNQLEEATNQLTIESENDACADIQSEESVNTEIGDDAATSPCVGFGVCETVPPPSDIAAGVANVIESVAEDVLAGDEEALAADNESLAATNEALASLNESLSETNVGLAVAKKSSAQTQLATYTAKLAAFEAAKFAGLPGVYFNSTSGDYAEWLPKADPSEKIFRGDIVGVKGGLISKKTEGAEKLMVVSTMPIVLGNAPAKEKEGDFEKVAFIGQVQVKVFGKVEPGDYILADGSAGFGVGKHAADMAPEDYSRIVGIAWEGSTANGVSYVNTAVGLNTNDIARVAIKQQNELKAQQNEIDELKKQMGDMNAAIAKLVPGYSAPATSAPAPVSSPVSAAANNAVAANTTTAAPAPVASSSGIYSGTTGVRYLDVTPEQFEEGFKMAEAAIRRAGHNPDKNPFLKKLAEDPSYKEKVYEQIQERFKKGIAARTAVNSRIAH